MRVVGRTVGWGITGLFMAGVAAAVAAGPPRAGAPVPPEGAELFEKQIRPLLSSECQPCHGPQVQQGGLRLDTRAAALKGGGRGPALVPGDPGRSLILRAVRHQGLQMPPG